MATFSQQFLANLGRPAMTESLFGLGRTIGGIPGQLQQRQQRREEAGMLAGLTPGSVEYNRKLAEVYQSRGDLARAASVGSLAREQEQKEKQQAADLQAQAATANLLMTDLTGIMNNQKISEQQRTKAANLLRVAAVQGERASVLRPQVDALKKEIEGSRLTDKQAADLVKEFTGDSVTTYMRTKNPADLKRYTPEEQEEVSEFTKLVRIAGYEDESVESQELHRARAESLSKFNVQSLGPVAQLRELRDTIEEPRVVKDSLKSVSQAQKAMTTIDSVKQRMARGEPVSEQVRVIERTVSELYNSDSRAASEIDRFLRGKGIKRAFTDWISSTLTGEPTMETLDLYQDMSETVERFSKNQVKNSAAPFIEMYVDSADPKVISKLNEIYYVDAPSVTSAEQPSEPSGISPDVVNKYLREAGVEETNELPPALRFR
jgi:hypothetical protein